VWFFQQQQQKIQKIKKIGLDVHREVEVAGRGTINMTHVLWEKVDLVNLTSLNLGQVAKVPKKRIGCAPGSRGCRPGNIYTPIDNFTKFGPNLKKYQKNWIGCAPGSRGCRPGSICTPIDNSTKVGLNLKKKPNFWIGCAPGSRGCRPGNMCTSGDNFTKVGLNLQKFKKKLDWMCTWKSRLQAGEHMYFQ
jgi:hypothetical protein